MVDLPRHSLISEAPHGTSWRRSERRRYGSGPEAHAELVVLHALMGQASYLVDGVIHDLRPGTLLWALVGQKHVLLRDTDAFDMRVLLISDAVLPGGEPEMPPLRLEERGPLDPRVVQREATDELETIATAARRATSPQLQALGLRWWLARAWWHWQTAVQGKGRPVHPAVERAAQALRLDPSQSLSEVADVAGLSAGRLSKVFHSETGQPLSAFRTEQRLGRVEAAVQNGERNLLSAALDAGFGSYAQFFRCFTARYGVSPRKYFNSS